ncbi:MAG TPA: sigma-54 dependent transcriptional regulator [Thermoanaerobaculia bacterium]|nr:sigma-54 dependent transcriptional regulator [Thermoanaerobaculia bacterium]
MTFARSSILVVDDEATIRLLMADYLGTNGFVVAEADSLQRAREVLRVKRYDAIILDYRLPDGVSLDFLSEIKAVDPDVAIVVLTAHGSIDLAVTAVKLGADHFMTKPVELAALKVMLNRLVTARRASKRDTAHRTRRQRKAVDPFVGTSRLICDLRNDVQRIILSDSPLLIQGETGSGKGVLARWIHEHGSRHDEPFVDLNCAGLARELVESELFGHERGAFTGAVATKQGLMEIADSGTMFLDEIGDMDMGLQAKLLKVVEEKRFRRVGDVRDRQADVRLIAATHRDLAARAREEKFRTDLYFRISTLRVVMPPLRERPEDIPALAETLLASIVGGMARAPARVTPDAVAELQLHSWPGNVRELRNVLERALLLHGDETISAADLRFDGDAPAAIEKLPDSLAALERQHILRIIQEEDGHVERAAARLGVPRSSLYQKLKRYLVAQTVS